MGIKISFTKGDKTVGKEISLGMSEEAKDNLKSFARKTAKMVEKSANKFAGIVDDFIEKIEDSGEDCSRVNINPDTVVTMYDVEVNLKEKISQIPEGKKFTLSEYLDYIGLYTVEKFDGKVERLIELGKFVMATKFTGSEYSEPALLNAPDLKEINYTELAKCVQKRFKKKTIEEIVKELKRDHQDWLERRPDIKKYCTDANFVSLAKYFAQKIKEAEND